MSTDPLLSWLSMKWPVKVIGGPRGPGLLMHWGGSAGGLSSNMQPATFCVYVTSVLMLCFKKVRSTCVTTPWNGV